MNDIENFFVYIIENKTFDGKKICALIEPENRNPFGFKTYEDAKNWIEAEGYRQVDYTIIQVLSKK